MPASFAHDKKMSKKMGLFLKPLMVLLDMVSVVVIMSLVVPTLVGTKAGTGAGSN